jgi:hypothetical protein
MPSTDTFCGACDTPIYDEASNNRQPCPQCAARTRRYELSAHAVCHASATAQLTVTTYPQTLLATAHDLLEREQYGIAVVVAHMACEVAAERTMAEAFGTKSIEHLEAPILAFINGFNLATQRIRELYSALTGDQIQQQKFWQGFTDSSKLRNSIMHNGKIAVRQEAEASLAAATALIGHLKK